MKRILSLWLLAILLCAVAMPVHADGEVYIVRPGDTMLAIAARYGLTATQLASANGLAWNTWVYVGQRLTIPGAGQSTASPVTVAAGGIYVVHAGDNLTGIAARHGVSVTGLAAANGMRADAWVYVGQQLRIPGAGSAGATGSSVPTPATGTAAAGTYIVRPGDTLIGIAIRHRLTVAQLAQANGMYGSSWVYAGQQLKIPGAGQAPSTPASPLVGTGGTYVVRPGDTLIGIAARHGVGVSRLAAVNGLNSSAWVYAGQRLQIPGAASAGSSQPPATTGSSTATGKWIDVNLSTQTLTAYEGGQAVHTSLVSTGTWRTPTVAGTYSIYAKYTATHMAGPGYSLPNVPYTMYFYGGYALHGTYWHNNFGTPMSHGCVNLPTPSAQWLFEWAPIGTQVVTHY